MAKDKEPQAVDHFGAALAAIKKLAKKDPTLAKKWMEALDQSIDTKSGADPKTVFEPTRIASLYNGNNLKSLHAAKIVLTIREAYEFLCTITQVGDGLAKLDSFRRQFNAKYKAKFDREPDRLNGTSASGKLVLTYAEALHIEDADGVDLKTRVG